MMLTTSRPALIDQLQVQLIQQPLPGHAAHREMAHAVRRVEPVPAAESTRNAAVLMTLFEKSPEDWHMIFIRRSGREARDKHAGQIGFPGGKSEPGDRDLMYTALREAHEETALDLTAVEVLGQLTPLYITVSKFMVHPFLAWTHQIPVMSRQESEVEEILEFPLRQFLDPSARRQTRIPISSGIVLNHVPAFDIHGHVIWGATAMIMNELLDILRQTAP